MRISDSAKGNLSLPYEGSQRQTDYNAKPAPLSPNSSPLQEGERVTAWIKEKVSANEALVEIQGKQYLARFKGGVPADRQTANNQVAAQQVTVQVEGFNGTKLEVKVIGDRNGGSFGSTGGSSTTANLGSANLGSANSGSANPATVASSANSSSSGSASATSSLAAEADRILKESGEKGTPELRTAVQKAIVEGAPATKELVREIKQILEKGAGTYNQKLQAIASMAKKGIPINRQYYQYIYQAQNGQPLNELLTQFNQLAEESGGAADRLKELQLFLAFNTKPSGVLAESGSFAVGASLSPSQLPSLTASLSGDNSPNLREQLLLSLEKWLHLTEESGGVSSVLQEIGKDPFLKSVLINSPEVTPEQRQAAESVELLVRQGKMYQLLGKTDQLAEPLQKALSFLQQSLLASESGDLESTSMIEQAGTSEQAGIPASVDKSDQAGIPATASLSFSREIVISRVTPELQQAAEEFASFQQKTGEQLSKISQLLQQGNANVSQALSAVKLLEPTIQMIDKAILSSSFTLYADMGTEKELLKASSDLAQAKAALQQGKTSEALQLIRQVQASIRQIDWKPADTSIQRFLGKEMLLGSLAVDSEEAYGQNRLGARAVAQTLQNMGLDYERQTAEYLAKPDNQANLQGENQNPPKNMKSILLQMIRDEAINPKTVQLADQALSNITGQQLLNKPDLQGNVQTFQFTLPLPVANRIEQVKVIVNSRKNGGQIDWENANLYFMLSTPKLGDTGIAVSVVNRMISLNIQNDQPGIEQRVNPLLRLFQDGLEEIGYQIGTVTYSKLTILDRSGGSVQVAVERNQEALFQRKEGLDIKI